MSRENGGVEFSDDEKQKLKQFVADARDSSITRRAALGGTAAALGAASFGAGRVTAQPSGSEGVIGQQNDRVDAWIDEADVNSLNIDRIGSVNIGEINSTLNAAEYSGTKADGILAAINDGGAGTKVHVPAGGGSGPNGEYILSPDSNGYAVDSFTNDVTLVGDGEGTVLMCEDGAPSDFTALVWPVDGWTVRDLVIDGNRANQTDGGNRLKQLGMWGNENEGCTFDNVTIRNTLYGPLRRRGVSDETWINPRFEGHGGGARWDVSGGGTPSENVKIVAPTCDGGSLGSDENYNGLILGDNCNSSTVVAPEVKSHNGDAFLIESCENVSVVGGTVPMFRSPASVSLNISGLVVEGGVCKTGSSRQSNFDVTVNSPTGDGFVVDDPERGNIYNATVYNAGGVPVRIQGGPRGGSLNVNIIESGSSNPGILLEDDDSGTAVGGLSIRGSVFGNGNLTYAVQAADADQTALIDGLSATGMTTDTVDNPGGLTVGDTL